MEWIKKYRDLIYILVLMVLGGIILSQCSHTENLKDELTRQENNRLTLVDEIKNYKDNLGRSEAEIRAYILTQEELRDSIGMLKKKNFEYLSYINSNIGIKDTVNIETVVVKNVNTEIDGGFIKSSKSETFGKSSRTISTTIPFTVENNTLKTGNGEFILDQNIFVEGWLEKNTKTGETYMRLRSDYPSVVFNSGMGIVAENSRAYEREMRKTFGIGVAVGPSVGLDYDLINRKIVPTVGVNITVGLTYTPKWIQW